MQRESIHIKRGSKLFERGSSQTFRDQSWMFEITSVPTPTGQGEAGRDADGSVRPGDDRSVLSRASRTTVLNVSTEARTTEILSKSIEKHNERLNHDW